MSARREIVGKVRLYEHLNGHLGEQLDSRWTVADDSGWLPGIYADREAALLVGQSDLSHEALAMLTDAATRGEGDAYRPVTADEVRAAMATV